MSPPYGVGKNGKACPSIATGSQHPEAWSPDGRFLVYSTFNPPTKFDLSIVSVTGNREAKPYLSTEFSEGQSQISPNGKWLAYTSNESGRWEVYVRGFPVPDGKWQISPAGGADPRWRRDGSELFYIAGRRQTHGAGHEH